MANMIAPILGTTVLYMLYVTYIAGLKLSFSGYTLLDSDLFVLHIFFVYVRANDKTCIFFCFQHIYILNR